MPILWRQIICKRVIAFIFMSAMTFACSDDPTVNETTATPKKVQFNSIQDVPKSVWETLAQKKIYFGHQSVGFEIVAGMNDLMKQYPQIRLNIVETKVAYHGSDGAFAHFRVGKNMDPESKVHAFKSFVENNINDGMDLAFFKLCYVDILQDTDIKSFFNEYKTVMTYLRQKYPQTIFIHSTVPITYRETGTRAMITKVKSFIKKVIGGFDWGAFLDNQKRNHLNQMIIEEYGDKEPVFDIAKWESTRSDGSRETYTKDGTVYYAMVPEYTYDGGHLNEKGRQFIAEHLLISLAEVINTR